MNMTYIIKRTLLALPLVVLALMTSCEEDAIVRSDSVSPYAEEIQLKGKLIDGTTLQNNSVVEMRNDQYSTDITFRLSTRPKKGVDIKIEVDEAYAQTYNTAHGTDFELFPSANVSFENNGAYVLAPDDQTLPNIGVTLTAFEGMKEDQTYIVPLAVSTTAEGVILPEDARHMVFLVKDYRSMPTPDKGADAPKNVVYFEVNEVNPLNALEFVTASGKYFFDHVVLFAANINWNAEKQRVYVSNNPNVQFLLDNNEEYLQPLRKAGMKVIISILGNHDEAGVAQLSDMGAREFARELAAYCDAYNLDGVAFDDEYSSAPDLSNPWFARRSYYAGSRLMYECKVAMPDKIVSLYNLGYMYSNELHVIDGVTPGEYCDYAVGDYGWVAQPGIGMTYKQCGGMSVELNKLYTASEIENTARNRRDTYGYFMYFALNPDKYGTQISYCNAACKGLYDEELVSPTYYYPKNSNVRTSLSELN